MGKSTISMAICNSYFDITRGYPYPLRLAMGMIRLSCAQNPWRREVPFFIPKNHWVGESDQLLETIVFTCFHQFFHLKNHPRSPQILQCWMKQRLDTPSTWAASTIWETAGDAERNYRRGGSCLQVRGQKLPYKVSNIYIYITNIN